ncbi:hypothetical protein [Streptomyces sp. NPDC004721]
MSWRDDGTDQTIHDLLRWQVREKERRKADPSWWCSTPRACTPRPGVPAQSTGCDTAKKYRAASAAWTLTSWGC